MTEFPDQPAQKWPGTVIFIACGFLCLLPIIAIQAPRFLTIAPALTALGLFLAHPVVIGGWPKLSCNIFGWMMALAALMAVSTLWAVNPDAALERSVKTAVLLFGGALLFCMVRTMDGALFRKYFPLAMILAGTLLCIDLYLDMPIFRLVHPDSPTLYAKHNLSGVNRSVVFFTLCVFPTLACLHGKYKSAAAIVFAVITALVLLQTDSQSAQLAGLGGLALYFFFPRRFRSLWVGLFAVTAIVMLAMPWIVQWGFDNFAAYSEKAGVEGSLLYRTYASDRLEIWDFIARRIMENPFIGYGADATEFITFDTAKLYYSSDHILHPHNFVLQLWLEYGVIGPLFALAFFGMLMKKIYDTPPEAQRPWLAILFATIAAAATSYDLWQGWWLGLFSLLAAYGALAVQKSPQ